MLKVGLQKRLKGWLKGRDSRVRFKGGLKGDLLLKFPLRKCAL